MSNKKPSNSRLSPRAKRALKAKGKQIKRFKTPKGPTLVTVILPDIKDK